MTEETPEEWLLRQVDALRRAKEVRAESPEETARRLGVPLIPATTPMVPSTPNAVVAVCGACGLELRQVMGYVCRRTDCPCSLRPMA